MAFNKAILLVLKPRNEFWADVIKRPNSFVNNKEVEIIGPFVDENEVAHVLLPSNTWNEFQKWLDSKNLRNEAKEIFGKRFGWPIYYSNIKELELKEKPENEQDSEGL
jgi:hypothetical protein